MGLTNKGLRKGFTLIELLVVIGIIGILSTVAIVNLRSSKQKAADAKKMDDLSIIRSAVELYMQNNNEAAPKVEVGGNFRTWNDLSNDLAPYIRGGVPKNPDPITTGTGSVYFYCQDRFGSPRPSYYLLGAVMTRNVALNDFDDGDDSAYLPFVECIASNGQRGTGSLDCDDNNAANPGSFSTAGGFTYTNRSILCIGKK